MALSLCPSVTSFLCCFVASFLALEILGFSLNWIFTPTEFDKKGNAAWSELFWPCERKYIIAKHVYTRLFALAIVCDCSFLSSSFDSGLCVACLVRMHM